MTTLANVNLTTGQKPTADELEAYWNDERALINELPAANLQKTETGRVQISITGDADTVDGYHAGEIAGADFAVIVKTLAELLVNSDGLVISGGGAEKNDGTANQLDISAIVAIQKDSDGKLNRVELAATTKTTSEAATTYYLDLAPDAVDYSWDTEHATAPYIPIAEVVTDGSGNISAVSDERPTAVSWFDSLEPVVGEGLELGETSATAYRGDRGAVAYTHSQVSTGAVHGAVSTATAGKMVVRDDSGRAQFADPSANQDAATKAYVDAIDNTDIGLGDVANIRQAPLRLTITAKTASYTLALADSYGSMITVTSASDLTVTVPPNASVAFPTGTQILVSRLGAGAVTIAAGSGVTLRSADSALTLREQYSVAGLLKTGTDTWLVVGDVTA